MQENRHQNEDVGAEDGGPAHELNEELEARFRHNSPNPRTEMIHFAHAAAHFAAVVRSVRLVALACGAEDGPPIPLTYEDFTLDKVVQARQLRATRAASRRVRADIPGSSYRCALASPLFLKYRAVGSLPAFLRPLRVVLGGTLHIARVCEDNEEETKVGDGYKEEEEKVDGEDCSDGAWARGWRIL